MFNNAGINKVFLVGHVGKTPRLHSQPDGQSFYCFPLATNEYIKKNEQSLEHTEWHLIKVPSSQLTQIAPNLDKGHLIYLEGKIKTQAFTDEEGIKRYKSEIVSNVFRVLNTNMAATPVVAD